MNRYQIHSGVVVKRKIPMLLYEAEPWLSTERPFAVRMQKEDQKPFQNIPGI
jgi:hypothetical protein